MSYILDALRKSEAQRRLGQTPDLASAPSGQRPPPRSHRRRLLVAGGVLALVAATSITLLITDRYSERGDLADVPSGPPTVEPSPSVPGAEQGLAGDPTIASTAPEAPAAEPPVRADRRSPDQRAATVVSRPAVRRPGEQSLSAGERERLVESAEEAQRLIDAELAAAAAAAGVAGAEQAPTPSRPQGAAAPASSTAPEAPGWTPERAEFMRVWELPLAIRRDLPQLDLSIHVYSAEPGRRFVLINGVRRLEGDALGEDTRLVEIRRDGALVDFRDYRFLLEP